MEDMNFCYNCFAKNTEVKCEKCGYDYNNDKYNDNDIVLLPNTLLNKKYKVGRVLGIGGFGITYKAQNIDTGNIVAVKEYVPTNITYRDKETNDMCIKASKFKESFDSGLMAFIEEANFLVLLKKYENIVNIYDCFNENNTAYFVMEFLDGFTFNEITNANYELAFNSMIKAAKALKVVHQKGIVHRDISPQNIFLLKNSDIKIIDFGNARYFNKNNANDDELVLKPGFSPPELYMKENVQGPWTDIYSLAATFYKIITGNKIPNALERINGVPIIPIKKFLPNIDYGLEFAVNKALELDYENRQRTIDEFLNDINNPTYTIYYNIGENNSKKINNSINKNVNINNVIDNVSAKNNTKKSKDNGYHKAKKIIKSYIKAYDGRQYLISDIKDIIIGRNASSSHIVINDVNISRKHCVIRCNSSKNEFYITDLSVNGTFINNTRLKNGVESKIEPNQSFYLFSPKYIFKVVVVSE